MKNVLSTLWVRGCLIGAAFVASGCYTAKALEIGKTHEWPRGIVSVFRDDTQLVIPLVAGKPSELSGAFERKVPGWATADLGTLAWGPIRRPDTVPGGPRQLTLQDGRAPKTPVPPYEKIPVLRVPLAALRSDEAMRDELREAVGSHTLVAETVGDAGLLLVRPDSQTADGLSMAYLHVDGREYRVWWTIPICTVAVAFTLPVDLVLMPLEIYVLTHRGC